MSSEWRTHRVSILRAGFEGVRILGYHRNLVALLKLRNAHIMQNNTEQVGKAFYLMYYRQEQKRVLDTTPLCSFSGLSRLTSNYVETPGEPYLFR